MLVGQITEENKMELLAFSIAAFIGLHLIPYFAKNFRAGAQAKIGPGPYKGLFALLVAASLAGIIFGWMESEPGFVYAPPAWGMHATPLFALVGFILFFASNAPTNIKRRIRHPQMTGVFLWSVGHLLANGEDRSLLLFGSFAVWSVLAILGANARDGVWIKPDKQPFLKDVVTILIGIVAVTAFMYFHEAIIGVRAYP